ncbi:MAG: hypothetical protein CVU87_06545 [Firmicutes bacterium HGW-Firmicutes-12]|nr:MAG: hypothetical protein CVU87_06545 [Firmicutes bacterium HGW-Firmicutes-12]
MTERIIAYVDKTMVKIIGLKIKGIKPTDIEKVLLEQVERPVRVIGVTSDSLQLDIYGLDPEAILRDEKGIIKAISLVPGLSGTEIAQIDQAEKAQQVDIKTLSEGTDRACPKERWLFEE